MLKIMKIIDEREKGCKISNVKNVLTSYHTEVRPGLRSWHDLTKYNV